MYRFKDLFVTLLPEESKLLQGEDAGGSAVILVRPRGAPLPPSTGCCDTAVSMAYRGPKEKGDPSDPLWKYLNAELAGAVVATDHFEDVDDLESVDRIEVIEKKLAAAQGMLRARKAQLQKQPMASK